MHLSFNTSTDALEYIETHARRDEYPFCYDRTNPHDMAHYKEIEQESTRLRAFNADVSGHSYLIGTYKLE